MAEPQETLIIEERQESIFSSSTSSNSTFRIAHFLKPTKPIHPFPPNTKLTTTTTTTNHESLRYKASFLGWPNPPLRWRTWVDRMESDHKSTWKEVGIDKAIMSSTHIFPKDHHLILCVVQKWCPGTNTFVFPWGEATITLEDVVVIGGFPVLGDQDLVLDSSRCLETEEKLKEARSQLHKSKWRKAAQSLWLKGFMESGSEIEHEAFLSLWLSRFVFPGTSGDVIQKNVLAIAARLAQGTKIALAQAVLAHLYRDLSSLKKKLVLMSEGRDAMASTPVLNLQGLFQLVQLWIWERFPTLSPIPNNINPGDPRSARWNKVKVCRAKDVKSVLESAHDSFLWRPYARTLLNWSLPRFYIENEEWVSIKSNSTNNDMQQFLLFLMGAELVGFNCKQEYSPCRVSRQFGLDQDVPQNGVAVNIIIRDAKLYVTSRHYEPGITAGYLDWLQKNADQCCLDSPKVPRKIPIGSTVENGNGQDDVPPGFKSKWKTIIEIDDSSDDDDNDEDHLLLSELFRIKRVKPEKGTDTGIESPSPSSSEADNTPPERSLDQSREIGGCKSPVEAPSEGDLKHDDEDFMDDEVETEVRGPTMDEEYEVMNKTEAEYGSPGSFDQFGIDLRARIDKLESVVAMLIASKHGQP